MQPYLSPSPPGSDTEMSARLLSPNLSDKVTTTDRVHSSPQVDMESRIDSTMDFDLSSTFDGTPDSKRSGFGSRPHDRLSRSDSSRSPRTSISPLSGDKERQPSKGNRGSDGGELRRASENTVSHDESTLIFCDLESPNGSKSSPVSYNEGTKYVSDDNIFEGVEYGDNCDIDRSEGTDWDARSERSRASSRGSVLTADSSRGSSYYQLSQNSTSVREGNRHTVHELDNYGESGDYDEYDDVVVASSSVSDQESELGEGCLNESLRLHAYDDSLDAGRYDDNDNDVHEYHMPGDRGASVRSPHSQLKNGSSNGGSKDRHSSISRSPGTREGRKNDTQPLYPSHQKRESALRHQQALYEAQRKLSPSTSPLESSLSHSSSSLALSLRSRASQLDPLEAAVDIFDR